MFCDVITGWLSGMVGTLIGHPFDTLKVTGQIKGINTFQATKYIYTSRGTLGFFQGMMFPFFTNGILNGIFFGIYAPICDVLVERRLSVMHKVSQTDEDEPVKYRNSYFKPRIGGTSVGKSPFSTAENVESTYLEMLFAGSLAGILQLGFSTPIELVKVKLQSQMNQRVFTGPVDCLTKIYKNNGFRGLYHGLTATAVRNVVGSGINYTLFYGIIKGSLSTDQLNLNFYQQTIPIAGVAGMASWIFIIPVDVIKSRLQADDYKNPIYRNMTHCGHEILKHHGIRGLFKGFWSASLRAFPVNACTFVTYHFCLTQCNKFKTV